MTDVSPKSQFYSLFREATFANKTTVAQAAANQDIHYTYIYNALRFQSNITLESADTLAKAVGYKLKLSFEPIGSAPVLAGNMEPTGRLFYDRKKSATKVELVKPSEEELEAIEASLNA